MGVTGAVEKLPATENPDRKGSSVRKDLRDKRAWGRGRCLNIRNYLQNKKCLVSQKSWILGKFLRAIVGEGHWAAGGAEVEE